MLFSVNYHSKHKKDAEEIRCPYNQLGSQVAFIKENLHKRYNVLLPDTMVKEDLDKAIEQIELIKAVGVTNYTIQCKKFTHLQAFLNAGYPAYLAFPISDWESFEELRKLKVSDIYIDGPLGFQMERLEKAKGDIKIRVSPTISPNISFAATRPATSFFIRPEDLRANYSAIDIIDFKITDQEKEDALFTIYQRGSFTFNINELIEGLPKFNNKIIKEEFGQYRCNCEQKCNIPGRSCHHCISYFQIIEYLTSLPELDHKVDL